MNIILKLIPDGRWSVESKIIRHGIPGFIKEMINMISTNQEGHRKRLRERFIKSGFSGFHDYEIVELLLTLGTPRKDCKQQAINILEKFKALQDVLEADPKELQEIKGIGAHNVFGLKLAKEIKRELLKDKTFKQPADKSVTTYEYLDKFTNKINRGDCIKLIKMIPDKAIDCIITDPPYGLKTKGIGNDNDLSLFYNILPDCHRVLKDDSFFITFFSIKHFPKLFKNNPFTYFWQFILYCPNGSVRSPIGFTKYMSCFIFKKGSPKLIKWKTDIFKDTPGKMVEPDEGFINHPTPKPKHFIKQIIEMTTMENALILDPFIGSGSTAVACKQLGRRFIGFEVNETYCSIANERLARVSNL